MDENETPGILENPENENENEANEDQKVTDEGESGAEGEKGAGEKVGDGDSQAEGEQTDVGHDDTEGAEAKMTGEEVGEEEVVSDEDKGGEKLGTEEQISEGNAEELEGELEEEEKEKKEEQLPQPVEELMVEEEEGYVEEPPPDPAAPYDLSDSKEALRPPFELRPDQVAEIEQLWEVYQNYTPAYTDLDGYITEAELVYMLKSLLLMTYTPEQLQELIAYCVRPPHPLGHITYDQFLKMVTLRQRDFLIEDELRAALQVLDPDKTGIIDREFFKELLAKQGHKMPLRQLDNLIKEVDLSNDGTVGIEDVIGTMCIDLNKEDILMLRAVIFPEENPPEPEDTTEY